MDDLTEATLDRAEFSNVEGVVRMTCAQCGTYLCNVDPGDTLAVLVRVALNHDNNWH